jgi:hypothetical protein
MSSSTDRLSLSSLPSFRIASRPLLPTPVPGLGLRELHRFTQRILEETARPVARFYVATIRHLDLAHSGAAIDLLDEVQTGVIRCDIAGRDQTAQPKQQVLAVTFDD